MPLAFYLQRDSLHDNRLNWFYPPYNTQIITHRPKTTTTTTPSGSSCSGSSWAVPGGWRVVGGFKYPADTQCVVSATPDTENENRIIIIIIIIVEQEATMIMIIVIRQTRRTPCLRCSEFETVANKRGTGGGTDLFFIFLCSLCHYMWQSVFIGFRSSSSAYYLLQRHLLWPAINGSNVGRRWQWKGSPIFN